MSAQFLRRIEQIPAHLWNAAAGPQPLLRHDFLAALEHTGCLRAEWGWSPYHVVLGAFDAPRAMAPSYLKGNSHGEFVFDWSWAQAYADAGLDYYPKLLIGVPYSPVTGPRLLGATEADKLDLVMAFEDACQRSNLSSVHANFLMPDDRAVFAQRQWIERCTVQFHYRCNGESDFDGFLARFSSKKRKNIRQERARVVANGFEFRVLSGDQIAAQDLAAAHRFYLHTFDQKANHAALTLAFFTAIQVHLVIIQALYGNEIVASAICFRDDTTLYGRYWGTAPGLETKVDCTGLHFETCYYQGIEYVLRERLERFEPGAQGEHKQARGFDPTLTWSAHFIKDPRFRAPIAQFCTHERANTLAYLAELNTHSPFRHAP